MNTIYKYINNSKLDLNRDKIILTKLNDAFNNIFIIKNKENNKYYLLEIFKLKKNIDYSLLNKFSNNNNLGVNILYPFNDGYIQEWTFSKNINRGDLNEDILLNIAKRLKEFHIKINKNHNNLKLSNIINTDGIINFVGYEFIDTLNIHYDIANFFCEWMYNYDKDDWYSYDINSFPSLSQINLFCSGYIQNDGTNINEFLDKVYLEIKNCHNYWIRRASNLKKNDKFILYTFLRKQLLEVNFKENNNKIIYCDGVFDLLHSGHLQFFKNILKIGCKKLIVGVISDENAESYKRRPILSLAQRTNILKNIKCVDKVISDCPFNSITTKFMNDYGIDMVIYGGDPKLKDPLGRWIEHYRVPYQDNKLKVMSYNDGISSSDIITKCKES